MSNSVAVAAVTETFSRVIEAAAQAAVAGVAVSNAAPEAPPAADPTRVIVYLYHASENAQFRADDLPTRNSSGAVLTKPQIALELDYLVSFYGQADQLEPERMLGSVVSTLHARPLLSAAAIQSAIAGQLLTDPSHFLGGSDLARQVEGVRVTPVDLGLEDMSKLWSVFFQQPYTLSVAYRVSVVLIEVEEIRQEGLPVTARQVHAVPAAAPYITAVQPAAVAYSASGAFLTLRGSSLAADRVVVRFGDLTAAPQLVTNQRIDVPVPGNLAAGVRAVHVAHLVDWGSSGTPDLRPVAESNRVAFAYQPEVESAPAAVAAPGPLVMTINPEVQTGQRIRLVLRETMASAGAAPPRSFETEQTAATTSHTVTIDLAGAPAGEFWLRLAVDDVTSPLEFDDTGFTGPKLAIT